MSLGRRGCGTTHKGLLPTETSGQSQAEGIVAVASATYRTESEENEDAVAAGEHRRLGNYLFLADGVGSLPQAGRAARLLVEQGRKLVRRASRPEDLEPATIFLACHKALVDFVATQPDGNPSGWGSTLLFVGDDGVGKLRLAWLGNGALLHMRGNFNQFQSGDLPPWSALNYLNPHTIENVQGKESLYRLVSADEAPERIHPSITEITRDDEFFGDIVIACTDGILSNDQIPYGRLADGSLWAKCETPYLKLFRCLSEFFAREQTPRSSSLESALQAFLNKLRGDNVLDDDASVGVLVTARALAVQAEWRNRRQKGSSGDAQS